MSDILDDSHIFEMSGSYEFYRDFHSMALAVDFGRMLEAHKIPYRIEKSQTLLDSAIVGHGLVPPALVKIRSMDFKKVNAILEKYVLESPGYVEQHYLQQLDDKELINIVRNPHEWTVEDTAIARRILNDRGIPIPKEHIEDFNQKRNAELRQGKKADPGRLVLYLGCVLIGGVLVTPLVLLIGIGMGWYYWQDRNVDNQGVKFYTFEPQTRLYGKAIFYAGWLCLICGGFLVFWSNG